MNEQEPAAWGLEYKGDLVSVRLIRHILFRQTADHGWRIVLLYRGPVPYGLIQTSRGWIDVDLAARDALVDATMAVMGEDMMCRMVRRVLAAAAFVQNGGLKSE